MSNLIIIRLARQIIALTEDELRVLLKANPVIWLDGIKRGKGVLRFERGQARKDKGARHYER